MSISLRSVILTSLPALAALLGFLWYRRKKKDSTNSNAGNCRQSAEPEIDGLEDYQHSTEMSNTLCTDVTLSEEAGAQGSNSCGRLSDEQPHEQSLSSGISNVVDEKCMGISEHGEEELPDSGVDSEHNGDSELPVTNNSLNKNTSNGVTLSKELSSVVEEVTMSPVALAQSKPMDSDVLSNSLAEASHASSSEGVIEPVETEVLSTPLLSKIEKTTDSAPLSTQVSSGYCDTKQRDEGNRSVQGDSLHVACTSSGDCSPGNASITGTGSSRGWKGQRHNAAVSPPESMKQESIASIQHTPKTALDCNHLTELMLAPEHMCDKNENLDALTANLSLEEQHSSSSTPAEDKDSPVSPVCKTTSPPPDSQVSSPGSSHLDQEVKNEGSSLSNCDAHSEVSVDSGRGTSVANTSPAAQSPDLPEQDYVVHSFHFPSALCGMLIGKNGRNINTLKNKSGADISVSEDPYSQSRDFQLVTVEGTSLQVKFALEQIKSRFPPRKFHGISFEHVAPPSTEGPVLAPEIMQLTLPSGVSVEVLVSSVVDVNHVFLQQPTHPTFPSLERLDRCMNTCYGQEDVIPQLPRPIEVGVICAAPMYNSWYRAQVVASHTDTDECDIKFVDYGGYMRMSGTDLKQIRSDFTTLPFQAVECYLANVVPLKGESGFSSEAVALLEELVHGKLIQAQVVGLEEDGVPYIQLYWPNGPRSMLVNREVVTKGIARWLEMST